MQGWKSCLTRRCTLIGNRFIQTVGSWHKFWQSRQLKAGNGFSTNMDATSTDLGIEAHVTKKIIKANDCWLNATLIQMPDVRILFVLSTPLYHKTRTVFLSHNLTFYCLFRRQLSSLDKHTYQRHTVYLQFVFCCSPSLTFTGHCSILFSV